MEMYLLPCDILCSLGLFLVDILIVNVFPLMAIMKD